MAFSFSNPLSSDGLDTFNYKWMVLISLTLSLVTFIIPLHPSYEQNWNEDALIVASMPANYHEKTERIPEVSVMCWCPAEFTSAYVDYINAYCGKAYNAVLRGEQNGHIYENTLENPNTNDKLLPLYESRKEYIKKIRQQADRDAEIGKKEVARRTAINNLKVDVQNLVTYQIPLLLLMMAFSFGIPHMIWSFLSDCLCSFNIGRTLEAAKQIHTLDTSTQNQGYVNLSAGISMCVSSSTKTAAAVYLLKKLSSTMLVSCSLLIVNCYALHICELGTAFDNISSPPTTFELPASNNTNSTYSDDFKCIIPINLGQKSHDFAIQCISVNDANKDIIEPTSSGSPLNADISIAKEKNILAFESEMLEITTAILVTLAVVNFISLFSWMFKLLLTRSKISLGLSSKAPLDIVFLLQMAHINTSADVTRRLARSSNDGFDDTIIMNRISNND